MGSRLILLKNSTYERYAHYQFYSVDLLLVRSLAVDQVVTTVREGASLLAVSSTPACNLKGVQNAPRQQVMPLCSGNSCSNIETND